MKVDIVLPKKSASAWKSKREERFDPNSTQTQEEQKHDVCLTQSGWSLDWNYFSQF